MKIKKYIVNDITEAIELIRKDLGEDAYILETKKIRKGLFGKSRKLEVVAVVEEEKENKRIKHRNVSFRNNPYSINDIKNTIAVNKKINEKAQKYREEDLLAPGEDIFVSSQKTASKTYDFLEFLKEQREISKRMDEGARKFYDNKREDSIIKEIKLPEFKEEKSTNLDKEIKEIKKLVENISKRLNLVSIDGKYTEIIYKLRKQDIHENIIDSIISQVGEKLAENWKNSPILIDSIRNVLKSKMKISIPELKGTIILVGPTGVGKTTTLAKLAAKEKIKGRNVGIVTIDTYRIAAVEQLKTYAEIMKIPYSVCYTPKELKETISSMTNFDVIFIDTAGRSHKDEMKIGELKMFVDHLDPNINFLVLAANTRLSDMTEAYEKFKITNPNFLIITKLDETSVFGQIPSISYITDLNISYITVGQNVPRDIEEPIPDKIISRILEEVLK